MELFIVGALIFIAATLLDLPGMELFIVGALIFIAATLLEIRNDLSR
jgi:UPF0716 family protein affecting phage T7 exclusion